MITGCRRGIGRTAIELFAAQGCNLIGCTSQQCRYRNRRHSTDDIYESAERGFSNQLLLYGIAHTTGLQTHDPPALWIHY